MKKRLLIAVTTMLMIALVGCGKEKTEKYEMETDSGKVTVEVTEDGDVSITEEIDKAPEFVYEEGTIPLGTYVREDGAVTLSFTEEGFRWVNVNKAGQYEYDLETKIYTLKTAAPRAQITAYIDEENDYNLVVTNWYLATDVDERGIGKIDVDNEVFDKTNSRLDIQEVFIRQ